MGRARNKQRAIHRHAQGGSKGSNDRAHQYSGCVCVGAFLEMICDADYSSNRLRKLSSGKVARRPSGCPKEMKEKRSDKAKRVQLIRLQAKSGQWGAPMAMSGRPEMQPTQRKDSSQETTRRNRPWGTGGKEDHARTMKTSGSHPEVCGRYSRNIDGRTHNARPGDESAATDEDRGWTRPTQ